jgi:wyosine [tRNA(Phe)-imidazoG37] synthetase (radical SAM superfamily)
MEKIVFGPVPSRRLGRSLGINNIPPKICSFSCVYCQLGNTLKLSVTRQSFYEPQQIIKAVEEKLKNLAQQGEEVDYLTFVPDGEPTLDQNLGHSLELLKRFKIKTAVITNSSLIWDGAVRQDLAIADWVSVKIDSVIPDTWKKINRPYGRLSLRSILQGLLDFSTIFKGQLVTETMMVESLNDSAEEIEKLADFLLKLKPRVSYLSIPTRPPAENWVKPPSEENLNRAYQILSRKGLAVELLTGYEGNAFASTGEAAADLLAITSVHPMREEAVREFLERTGSSWDLVQNLMDSGQLIKTEYQGHQFYLRKLKKTGDILGVS